MGGAGPAGLTPVGWAVGQTASAENTRRRWSDNLGPPTRCEGPRAAEPHVPQAEPTCAWVSGVKTRARAAKRRAEMGEFYRDAKRGDCRRAEPRSKLRRHGTTTAVDPAHRNQAARRGNDPISARDRFIQ